MNTLPATPFRPPRAQQGTGRRCLAAARRMLVALVALAALATSVQAQNAVLPAVVVWDYENQSALAAPGLAQADFLRRSLSESLTATLLQVPGLPVVERQRLQDLLAEQKLGSTALADDDARLRLGKIVGAQRMVFGGFFVLGDQVQVHVRVIDTATSRVLFSDESVAPVATVMAQVVTLNARVARALGGGAVVAQGHAPERWQAYDRALALADAGDFDAAITALQQLLAADKTFLPAERQLVALLERGARR